MLLKLILFLASYLLGSISSAIIVSKIMRFSDPRGQGSHNPGATNVLRIAGKKAAFITLIGDILKGLVPVLVAKFLGFSMFISIVAGMAAFIGHVYPVFFKFKGGKGVATFFGILFGIVPVVGFLSSLTWLIMAKIIKVSSLSALVTAFLTPFYFYFYTYDVNSSIVLTIICIVIFITHRANIKRILAKEEDKINSR